MMSMPTAMEPIATTSGNSFLTSTAGQVPGSNELLASVANMQQDDNGQALLTTFGSEMTLDSDTLMEMLGNQDTLNVLMDGDPSASASMNIPSSQAGEAEAISNIQRQLEQHQPRP